MGLRKSGWGRGILAPEKGGGGPTWRGEPPDPTSSRKARGTRLGKKEARMTVEKGGAEDLSKKRECWGEGLTQEVGHCSFKIDGDL